MKNLIRVGNKTYTIKNKILKGGEIQCYNCGCWEEIKRFKDKHFTKVFLCKECTKDMKNAKKKKNKVVKKKKKKTFPKDCKHVLFFRCKKISKCAGCYYNPDWNEAKKEKPGDHKKTKKYDWFYGDKKHARECLALLEDIRKGVGLLKNGNRCYFKFAKQKEDYDEFE